MKEFSSRVFWCWIAFSCASTTYHLYENTITTTDRYALMAGIAFLVLAAAIRALGPRKP